MTSLLFWRCGWFDVCGRLLQLGNVRSVQLIESWFVLPLRDVPISVFCNENFLDTLAAIRCHRYVHGWRRESSIDKLACRQIANLADESSHAVRIHFCCVGRPILAAAAQRITLRPVVQLYFVRIGIAEIEDLLAPEIIEALVESCSDPARNFVHTLDDARLCVIIVFVLPQLQFLRSGSVRDFRGGDRSAG